MCCLVGVGIYNILNFLIDLCRPSVYVVAVKYLFLESATEKIPIDDDQN